LNRFNVENEEVEEDEYNENDEVSNNLDEKIIFFLGK